jgi:hypothetical protein
MNPTIDNEQPKKLKETYDICPLCEKEVGILCNNGDCS